MDNFNAYQYETEKFGTTLFIFKKLSKTQILKVFPISSSISFTKLYCCIFITENNEYLTQGEEDEIQLILNSIEKKILFDNTNNSLNNPNNLFEIFKENYDRIKNL